MQKDIQLVIHGYPLAIQVNNYANVSVIKGLIAEKTGIPLADQILSFQGKILNDSKIVSSYGIENNSFLHLTHRLQGGAFDKDEFIGGFGLEESLGALGQGCLAGLLLSLDLLLLGFSKNGALSKFIADYCKHEGANSVLTAFALGTVYFPYFLIAACFVVRLMLINDVQIILSSFAAIFQALADFGTKDGHFRLSGIFALFFAVIIDASAIANAVRYCDRLNVRVLGNLSIILLFCAPIICRMSVFWHLASEAEKETKRRLNGAAARLEKLINVAFSQVKAEAKAEGKNHEESVVARIGISLDEITEQLVRVLNKTPANGDFDDNEAVTPVPIEQVEEIKQGDLQDVLRMFLNEFSLQNVTFIKKGKSWIGSLKLVLIFAACCIAAAIRAWNTEIYCSADEYYTWVGILIFGVCWILSELFFCHMGATEEEKAAEVANPPQPGPSTRQKFNVVFAIIFVFGSAVGAGLVASVAVNPNKTD